MIDIRKPVVVILVIGLSMRLLMLYITPPFYAPDEEPHFNYIRYLYKNKELPIQQSKTGEASMDWEYHQPPLYYLLLAPIYGFGKTIVRLPLVNIVRSLRLFSVLLWCLISLISYQILKNFRIKQPLIYVTVFSFLAMLPSYLFISAVINNDNLLIFMGAVILLLLSQEMDYKRALLLGICLGVSLLVKFSGIVYLIAVLMYLLIVWFRSQLSFSKLVVLAAVILAVTLLFSAPIWLRNIRVYGVLTTESVANTRVDWDYPWIAILGLGVHLLDSFWAVAGVRNDIRFYAQIGQTISLISAWGLLRWVFYKRIKNVELGNVKLNSFLISMSLAVVVNVVLALRFAYLYGQSQGRFIYPLLIPTALLFGYSWQSLPLIRRVRKLYYWPALVMFCYASSFIIFYLYSVIQIFG